jgi:hypothetical protein
MWLRWFGQLAHEFKLQLRIPVNVTADSGIVTGIPVNVTAGRCCAF